MSLIGPAQQRRRPFFIGGDGIAADELHKARLRLRIEVHGLVNHNVQFLDEGMREVPLRRRQARGGLLIWTPKHVQLRAPGVEFLPSAPSALRYVTGFSQRLHLGVPGHDGLERHAGVGAAHGHLPGPRPGEVALRRRAPGAGLALVARAPLPRHEQHLDDAAGL
eukprot:CAMPEP_0118878730 /NCGR_PEP_ID=MMETSP1163-20130328/18634_1 /TAXON_ID=124430 /ORGANISM="Phaeomonas parva, Strain CCMP2877" /LENGTH=164 /DNA_ID=CAMNT_0006814659 /DNA_START=149 /DNA_END=644 /DNA_ORIENTATION=-